MIGDKIKQLRKQYSYTQAQLAKKIDMSQQAIARWENGTASPNPEMLIALAEVFNVTVDYLIGKTLNQDEAIYLDATASERIPVVGVIKAGYDMYAEQNILGYKYTDKNKTKGKECFWLKVTGDSMNAVGIFNGSLVLVERRKVVDNKRIAIVRINGDEATVKQVIFNEENVILQPRSTDPSYLPQIVKAEDFESGYAEIIGEVIDVSFNPNELFK